MPFAGGQRQPTHPLEAGRKSASAYCADPVAEAGDARFPPQGSERLLSMGSPSRCTTSGTRTDTGCTAALTSAGTAGSRHDRRRHLEGNGAGPPDRVEPAIVPIVSGQIGTPRSWLVRPPSPISWQARRMHDIANPESVNIRPSASADERAVGGSPQSQPRDRSRILSR